MPCVQIHEIVPPTMTLCVVLSFSLVHFLLDEIVGSTVHRCVDPHTMEMSVSTHTFSESFPDPS